MIHNLKALIEQQFIISKLKKEAKIFKRNNPHYNLMEAQDIIAKQHGYLHWHEVHTLIKNKLELLDNFQCFDFNSHDNFFLGKDDILNKNIYLKPDFHFLNIQKNNHTQNLLFNLYKETMNCQNKFIYCSTEINSTLEENMKNFAHKQNIPVYQLSFIQKNLNNISINFDTMSSGAITELFVKLILDNEDDDALMWSGRAISMGSCLFMALVYLRNIGEIKLSPKIIREYLIFDNFIKLYHRTDFPKHIHAALKSYLYSLPQFNEFIDKQNDTFLENHGYLQMQYIKALGVMVDIYSYIFEESHIDLFDILKKKEKFLLIVNFPDLKKYYDSLSLFTIFYNLFLNSLTHYILDKDMIHYPYYILLENIEYNLNLPNKLLSLPINFITTANTNSPLTIIPTNNGILI